tara:strand:+ start:2285 stop:3259 length:975 start_codon:yes stop_codon:yes gene_type:complete
MATPEDNTPIDDQLNTLANPDAPDTLTVTTSDDLSDEDLALLHPSEREAYLADREDEADDAGEGAADGAQGGAAEEDADANAQAEADRLAAEAAERAALAERRNQTVQQATSLQSQLEQTQQKQMDDLKAYQNGDLSDEEYNALVLAAQSRLSDLSFQMGATTQPATDSWEAASAAFMEANPILQDEEHFNGFNQALAIVDQRMSKMGATDEEILAAALRSYSAQMEAVGAPLEQVSNPESQKAGDDKKAGAKPEDEKLKVKPASERPSGPTTLADLPSETIDPNQSQFDAIIARIDNEEDFAVRERLMASLPDHILEEVLQRP